VSGEVIEQVLSSERQRQVLDRLDGEQRVRIEWHEFESMCASEGLSADEAAALGRALHSSGRALRFSSAPLQRWLYLQPHRLAAAVARLLDTDGSLADRTAHDARVKLDAARAELQQLQAQKDQLDRLAYARADRIIYSLAAYLVLQGAVVARLTWWELSWDIMEPVTYMLTFGGSMLAVLYFTLNKTEFTYDAWRATLARKRMSKLYARNDFDEAMYHRLQHEIAELEHRVHDPDRYLLQELGRPELL
jgi:calcium uniporter protein, mitochondrial